MNATAVCDSDIAIRHSDAAVGIRPMSPTIGAEIDGVDLRAPLQPETFRVLERALHEWKVLFFHDQDITTEQHLAFARCFGELEVHPFATKRPGCLEVSAVDHDAGRPGTENHWHNDVTWRQVPSLGSVARMIEAPPVGGDTLFADMCAAYDGLPPNVKDRVDGLVARHDFPKFRENLRRAGASAEDVADIDRHFPDPYHPVIRTHPRTGRRAIFVNAAFTQEIVGIDPAESTELLDLLERQASVPEYQVRFRWRTNSVAFWDNRSCQHYAVSDYRPHRRRLERVTIAGDRPFFDPCPPAPATSRPFFFASHVGRPHQDPRR